MARLGRQIFVQAALDEDNKSRVPSSDIQAAVTAAIAKADLGLRAFSSGSVGSQVRLKVTVTNDEGDEFDLTGQLLLTIPETVTKKASPDTVSA